MRSTAICYSPADSGAATELRCYLETNCPVAIEDGVVQMGSDLLDAVETGLSFDYVLVLLSADSTQPAWARTRWEPVLFEQAKQLRTRIVYVLLTECKFPAVLRRETFFDLSRDFANGRRSLKRWLLAELAPAASAPKLPERTGSLAGAAIDSMEPLADWPELTQTDDREAALAFAYARQADFEAVVWLNCARRGRPGVLGDAAHALGLRLEGNWEDNAQALRDHCAEHRVLLLFENLDSGAAEMVNFGGRASVILVESAEMKPRRSLGELLLLFSSWKRNAERCLAELGDAESCLDSPEILQDEFWPDACTLCLAAVGLLRDYGRFAEAYDLLTRISSATQVRGDLTVQRQVEWETSWIVDRWGQPMYLPGRMAAALTEPTQLSLFA
jgi:hypothetical protein